MKVQFLILFYLYFLVEPSCCKLKEEKIFLGQSAERGMFPFVVSIVKWKDDAVERLCAGGILTNQLIVSGCQCFVNFTGEYMETPLPTELGYYQVWAGSINLFHKRKLVGEQGRGVEMILMAPQCRDTGLFGYEYDFAILKLTTPLIFNYFIQPMPLGDKDTDKMLKVFDEIFKTESNCYVMGWGRLFPSFIRPEAKYSNQLFYCVVKLYHHNSCSVFFCKNDNEVVVCIDRWSLRKEFCAAPINVCNTAKGDHGSPIICNGYVIGILGYGSANYMQQARVYTPLYYILDTFKISLS